MPVNLNAFIRYKTIDSCLRNQFVNCDIEYLIKKCSEAISNKVGENMSVSERTIRNDIRVLRSDILGFEAPIICECGIYKYSESDFSIFNIPIADKELLIEIQNLLVEEFDSINSPKVKNLIYALASITGKKIPKKCAPEDLGLFQSKIFTKPRQPSEDEKFINKLDNYLFSLTKKGRKPKRKNFLDWSKKTKTSPTEVFKWEFILIGF